MPEPRSIPRYVLLLLLSASAALAQPGAPYRSFLWSISDADNTVYLLGSVHLLTPDDYPLPEETEAAYADAEVVAFEVDLDLMDAQASALLKRGLYTDGSTLADHLAPTTYALLDSIVQSLGLRHDSFDTMKPWLVNLALTSVAIVQHGYSPDLGVDRHFFTRAKVDGKPRLALETVDDQVRMLSDLPPPLQEQSLLKSLDDLRYPDEAFSRIMDSWRSGDPAALEARLNEAFGDAPLLREELFDQRNRAWVPQIEALLSKTTEDVLVVVGAGHLIGDTGLIALLEAEGHELVRH